MKKLLMLILSLSIYNATFCAYVREEYSTDASQYSEHARALSRRFERSQPEESNYQKVFRFNCLDLSDSNATTVKKHEALEMLDKVIKESPHPLKFDVLINDEEILYLSGLRDKTAVFMYFIKNKPGINIDLLDQYKIDKLFLATCSNGNARILTYLRDNGKKLNINVNYDDNIEESAIYCLIEGEKLEALVTFLDVFKNQDIYIDFSLNLNWDMLLEASCKSDNLKVLKAIVKEATDTDVNFILSDINRSYKTYGPLLHFACKYDSINIVKYLISKGADINLKYDNSTPFILSLSNPDIIVLLIKSGCKLDRDKSGKSYLCWLHREKLIYVLKKLESSLSINLLEHLGNFITDLEILFIFLQQSINIDMPEVHEKLNSLLVAYDENESALSKFEKVKQAYRNMILDLTGSEILKIDFKDISLIFSHSQMAEIIREKMRKTKSDLTIKALLIKVKEYYNLKDLVFESYHIIWESIIQERDNITGLILSLCPQALDYLPAPNGDSSVKLFNFKERLNAKILLEKNL